MELNFGDMSDILGYFKTRVRHCEFNVNFYKEKCDSTNLKEEEKMYSSLLKQNEFELAFCKDKVEKISKISIWIEDFCDWDMKKKRR